jgi:tellurite methyltransferase
VPAGDARERWNRRYRDRPPSDTPAGFLVDRAGHLPMSGRALDVGGGGGRNAIWLAARGLAVTLADVSDEACATAARRAEAAGVDLDVLRLDVERAGLPPGPWDVVVFHHFLDRDLIHAAAAALAPGGTLLVAQPTVRNLERDPVPSRRWLLETGELARIAAELPDVDVLELTEAWTPEGQHAARLVARRRWTPAPSPRARPPGHG